MYIQQTEILQLLRLAKFWIMKCAVIKVKIKKNDTFLSWLWKYINMMSLMGLTFLLSLYVNFW